MDTVKTAFGLWMDNKFQDAKDILRDEIRNKVGQHLQDTLGLEKNPIGEPQQEYEPEIEEE